MDAHKRIEAEPLPTRVSEGKDELNLAEFPLCAIADRLDPAQKTLVFEDRIFDRTRGGMIPRQLTITGSDAYGLPTALDDEVLLGLVQLSKLHQFADRKVPFTRYQLVQLLGWRDEGKSYERLEQSLNRWTGVTLYYQNAWWNKAEQCWVNEKLHVLDNVTLAKVPRSSPKPRRKQPPLLSSFVWNDVVFRSFQAGNLKRLDFEFYQSLGSAVAKRLYRFLDKRFFRRRRWEFNMKELAWEHVGLARNYDVANLKRKLRPAIAELEQRAFLKPLAEGERFRKIWAGEWQVMFEKAHAGLQLAAKETEHIAKPDPLMAALMARGVSSNTAGEMVKRYPAERIQSQLEIFDWLVARKDPKLARNPAGFLVTSIKSDYAAPPEFAAAREQQQRAQCVNARKQRGEQLQRQRAATEQRKEHERQRAIDQFWQSLPEPERQRVEKAALAAPPLFQRKLLAQGGSLARTVRQSILDAHALRALETGR
mgnify:CR=1 FL=1